MISRELLQAHAARSLAQYLPSLEYVGKVSEESDLQNADAFEVQKYVEQLQQYLAEKGTPEDYRFLLQLAIQVPGRQRGIHPPLALLEPGRGGSKARLEEAAGQLRRIGEALSAGARLLGPPNTHRLHNVGEKTYEVLDVEFFKRPEHPSEIAAATVAAENPSARVYKWNLAPGGATTLHVHEHPYILVAVTSSRLKTTAPNGTSAIEVVEAGDPR
jgi:hypothetical protein